MVVCQLIRRPRLFLDGSELRCRDWRQVTVMAPPTRVTCRTASSAGFWWCAGWVGGVAQIHARPGDDSLHRGDDAGGFRRNLVGARLTECMNQRYPGVKVSEFLQRGYGHVLIGVPAQDRLKNPVSVQLDLFHGRQNVRFDELLIIQTLSRSHANKSNDREWRRSHRLPTEVLAKARSVTMRIDDAVVDLAEQLRAAALAQPLREG